MLTVAAAGCAKSEDDEQAGAQDTQGQQQVVADAARQRRRRARCRSSARRSSTSRARTVGFSQSEKEANPFRIAETQSIKDEAAKLGHRKLLTTNAQSQRATSRSATSSGMIAQGAQAADRRAAQLRRPASPRSQDAAAEEGPDDHRSTARSTRSACKDYVTFIGSDFVEQGKRAADAMIKATGGKGKVAILLGASGNNVTDRPHQRASTTELKAKDAGHQGRLPSRPASSPGRRASRSPSSCIQSNPDINAIYAENDEMGLGAVTALKGAGKNGRQGRQDRLDRRHQRRGAGHRGRLASTPSSSPTRASARWRSRPLDDVRERRGRPGRRSIITDNASTTRPTPAGRARSSAY